MLLPLNYNEVGIVKTETCSVLGDLYCLETYTEQVFVFPLLDLLMLIIIVAMPLITLSLIYKFSNLRKKL